MTKRAVVLFNLGGPDHPDAVEPFLFNLFNDPAVITLPWIARWPLARYVSSQRTKVAQKIYEKLGGSSPLLANTKAQAAALQAQLGAEDRVFVAMRYWHPMTAETVLAVKDWGAEEVLLLPLYPQFSTTSSGSSIGHWYKEARRLGLDVPTRAVCCYPTQPGFIAAIAAEMRETLALWPPGEKMRVLFSAHGLPERIVRKKGDPYAWQARATVDAILAELAMPGLDAVLCYQSRVGRMKWLEPSVDNEIRRAGAEKTGLLVVPIAFVSEHSETLVELDIEYRHLAGPAGVPVYIRVPTVSVAESFIAGLASLVERGFAGKSRICSGAGARICPPDFAACPCRSAT